LNYLEVIWDYPKKGIIVAAAGLVDCDWPFTYGDEFELEIVVEEKSLLFTINGEYLHKWPHGGYEACLKDASRISFTVANTEHFQGPETSSVTNEQRDGRLPEFKFRDDREKFHITKMANYHTDRMLQIFRHIDADKGETLEILKS